MNIILFLEPLSFTNDSGKGGKFSYIRITSQNLREIVGVWGRLTILPPSSAEIWFYPRLPSYRMGLISSTIAISLAE